jgi:glycosyltransferase involved in cell wall biosynthesis
MMGAGESGNETYIANLGDGSMTHPAHYQKTIMYVHSNDEMYGADFALLSLVTRLDRERYRPIVVLPQDISGPRLLSKKLGERSIETVHVNIAVLRRRYFTAMGSARYLWTLIASTVALSRMIHRENVDIVHSNTLSVLPGALAALLTGRPNVWHVLEMITRPRWLWRLTSWLAPRLSVRVVAASGPTRDHLCKGDTLNCTKAVVIHNGIDASRFADADDLGRQVREEWAIGADQLLVGMVGRISHWKGQDYFLQVAKRVAEKCPQARFAIVGGTVPGDENRLRDLRASADQMKVPVIFSDFRSDMPAVLNAYDVFVMPSTLPDPFPTVVLEAMAAGRPVVANAMGGSIEMVEQGRTGLLIEPGHSNQMADAIVHLLMDPVERQAMGARARERVKSQFSVEACISKWLAVYEALS